MLLVALFFPFLLRKWRAGQPAKQPVVTVSMLRLEKRPAPKPTPAPPLPRPTTAPTPNAPIVHQQATPARILAAHASAPSHRVVPPHVTLNPRELAHDDAAFAQTIAKARTAQDPVAGAQTAVVPETIQGRGFNASSISTVPASGEGYLSPMRRWVNGDLAYYYVRYSVTYPDGTFETGIVPWPIHFPLHDDPFARGLHSMPLPGPASDYVAAADVEMHPLVKNCYDHHYDYCPIEHEGGVQ